jgi:hypothetical protein
MFTARVIKQPKRRSYFFVNEEVGGGEDDITKAGKQRIGKQGKTTMLATMLLVWEDTMAPADCELIAIGW